MKRKFQLSRVGLFLWLVLVLAASAVWIGDAQQSGTPGQGPQVTGKHTVLPTTGIGLSNHSWEPGARSYWHTHGSAQVLFVKEGRIRYQIEGGRVLEAGTNASVYLPPGVRHWHGAALNEGLTHVGLTFGGGLKWMEEVTDEQYSGKAK